MLFVLALLLATGLTGLVAVAPWLDANGPAMTCGAKLVALFARDIVVRRTALGGSAGLVATAFVFFRPPYSRPPRAPTDVIGA